MVRHPPPGANHSGYDRAMASTHALVADLAAVTGVAALTSVVARALNQPLVVGYLFAGLIVGPYLPVPVFADVARTHALAELGVVLVMFAVGLEFRVQRLLGILPTSGFTGLIQVGALLWAGFTTGQLLGWSTEASAFLGAALAISSTMVVTGVFADMEVDPDTRSHVLAVLVFQDVVAIVLIAAMTALAAGQSLAPAELFVTLAQLGAVLTGLLIGGVLMVPPLVRRATRRAGPATLAVVSVGLAFGFAAIAEALGYSPALGAFVAGMVVAESGESEHVEHVVAPLRDVFAAIFFVSVGMEVDPRVALAHLPTSVLVAAVVIAGQLASVSVAGVLSGVPLRRAVVAGLALGQIGEFSFILAAIGVSAGVAPPSLAPILVTVAALTAFTTPKLLGTGDALVSAVARRMPHRVQQTLTLLEEWVARLRTGGLATHPMRTPLTHVGIDSVALVGLFAAAASTQQGVRHRLEGWSGWDPAAVAGLLALTLVVLAAPFAWGLAGSLRALAAIVTRLVLPGVQGESRTGRAAEQIVSAVFWFAAFLGIGVPGLAVLRPLVAGGIVEGIVLAGTVAGTAVLWRRMGAAEGALRSGAEVLARQLAEQLHTDEVERPPRPSPLERLADMTRLRIEAGTCGVERTLAELDIRARTGATVVAIQRDDTEVILPTGHERLQEGDALAVMGSAEALQLAEALLSAPAPSP